MSPDPETHYDARRQPIPPRIAEVMQERATALQAAPLVHSETPGLLLKVVIALGVVEILESIF